MLCFLTFHALHCGAVEDPDALLSRGNQGVKHVFRLLRKSDVSKQLVGREVFTLWPDNGMWYKGKVRKCNPADMSAMLYYQETNEKEEADLEELVNERQIAFCTLCCTVHTLCVVFSVSLEHEW